MMDLLDSHDDCAAAVEHSHGSFEDFSPAGLRVLVVDDDKLCLKVISRMLQQCSYEGAYLFRSACLHHPRGHNQLVSHGDATFAPDAVHPL